MGAVFSREMTAGERRYEELFLLVSPLDLSILLSRAEISKSLGMLGNTWIALSSRIRYHRPLSLAVTFQLNIYRKLITKILINQKLNSCEYCATPIHLSFHI